MPFDRNGVWSIPTSKDIEDFKESLLKIERTEITPTPELMTAIAEKAKHSSFTGEGVTGLELFRAASQAVNGIVDIIIPIYGGLHVLKPCIDSILTRTNWPYNLYLVNDASPDPLIKRYIENFNKSNIIPITLNKNRGFAAAVNTGILSGNSKYICILNSDVVVTYNWLTKMVFALEANEKNQIVNPITNNTALTNVNIYAGQNYITMNQALERQRTFRYPETMPTGFCYMFKRELIDKVGMLDEAYGGGYGEDTNHWFKTIQYRDSEGNFPRYRAVLADNCYLFHERSTSFSQLDNEKHMGLRRGGSERFHKLNPYYKEWIKGFNVEEKIGALRTSIPSEAFKIKNTKGNFAWVVKSAGPCGGMFYIADIINQMIEEGFNVKLCVIPDDPESSKFDLIGNLKTMPILFKDYKDFIETFSMKVFNEGTIFSAVSELTPAVARLTKYNKKLKGINHVQSWDPLLAKLLGMYDKIEELTKAYTMLPNIVSSKWVADEIKKIGGEVIASIPPGVNTDLFHYRGREYGDDRFTVAIMALKNYPWKRYDRVVDFCKALWNQAKDKKNLRILAIGIDSIPECPYVIGLGGLTQSRIAQVLGTEVDVFVDPSEVHSYGLPALEALVSNCHVVCWENEGVNEYKDLFPTKLKIINNENSIDSAAEVVLSFKKSKGL